MSKRVYVLAGQFYNQLARAMEEPLVGFQYSGYEPAWAYDGDPSRPMILARRTGVNQYVQNLEQVSNPSFEETFVGGLPDPRGWSKSSNATLTRSTSLSKIGSASLRVEGTGVGRKAIFTQQVAADETLNVALSIYGATVAYAYCRNSCTGNYLQSVEGSDRSLDWAPGRVPFVLSPGAGAAWLSMQEQFIVEDFFACGLQEPKLIWELSTDDVANFDGFSVWPKIDFLALIGHNMPPSVPLEFRSNKSGPLDTALVPSLYDTISCKPDVHFVTIPGTTTDMSWSLVWNASRIDSEPIYVGEIVMGQKLELQKRFDAGIKCETLLKQDRPDDENNSAVLRAVHPQRKLTLNFKHSDQAAFDEFDLAVLARSKNGAYPIVMVHDSEDPSSVLLGRVSPIRGWQHISDQAENRASPQAIAELPLPNIYTDDV